jgi:cytosine deaminase
MGGVSADGKQLWLSGRYDGVVYVLSTRTGKLLHKIKVGRGRNRRVQDGDPSAHGETAAFRDAGRQPTYRGTTMVTTLSPCWYCSGLIRQFGIPRLVVGECRTFMGQHEWLARHGVEVVVLDSRECVDLMTAFIAANPALWNEDIGK